MSTLGVNETLSVPTVAKNTDTSSGTSSKTLTHNIYNGLLGLSQNIPKLHERLHDRLRDIATNQKTIFDNSNNESLATKNFLQNKMENLHNKMENLHGIIEKLSMDNSKLMNKLNQMDQTIKDILSNVKFANQTSIVEEVGVEDLVDLNTNLNVEEVDVNANLTVEEVTEPTQQVKVKSKKTKKPLDKKQRKPLVKPIKKKIISPIDDIFEIELE